MRYLPTGTRGEEDGQGPYRRIDLPHNLAALARVLRERSLSPVEATSALLSCIEERDGELNAFVTVLPEQALQDARRAEKEILGGGYRGPLHGVPIGLKYLIYTEGIRITMSSSFFKDFFPKYDATVVRKLKEAGAVILGKTNTQEFAYGPTGDRSYFGPTRHPYDLTRISGGSSGGSGAAVAASLLYGALGSDTGGSIRIPSALWGVAGMKPTFGRVSKHGVFPLSWTVDHAGPFTRTVEDNALLLTALAGYDSRDPYSVNEPAENFIRELDRGIGGGRIGVPVDFYFEHIEGKVEEKVREAAEAFSSRGAKVLELPLPGYGRRFGRSGWFRRRPTPSTRSG